MRVIRYPQWWVFDVTLFAAGTTYVVGGAYTMLKNTHVKMDVLYIRLTPRKQSFLDVLTFSGFAIFCGALVWLGGERALEATIAGETFFSAWNPPLWPVLWTIPIGGLLILLQGLAKFIRDFHMVIKGERLD